MQIAPAPDDDSPPPDNDSLKWTDVAYTVSVVTHRGFLQRPKRSRKLVLSELSGHVKSGEMCALMGPSGSGKSSLLGLLAGHIPAAGRLESGSVLFNGAPLDALFRRQAGLVFQDDLLLAALTVRETVEFAAKLRLPQHLGDAAREARVQETLEQLGLLGCADTQIGNEKQRGVSGGERKRAAVASALVARPPLLFLDEPTSGLDAATALLLVRALRRSAQRGMMVICSVHQPRSNIYSAFDSLLLLARGRTAYFGPTGAAIEHMRVAAGLHLPPLTNPADWLIDIVDAESDNATTQAGQAEATALSATVATFDLVSDFDSKSADDVKNSTAVHPPPQQPRSLADVWRAQTRTTVTNEPSRPVQHGDARLQGLAAPQRERRYPTSLFWQFRVLLARSTRQQRGDVFNTVNVFQIIAVAVIAALIWSGATAIPDIVGVLFFVNIQRESTSP